MGFFKKIIRKVTKPISKVLDKVVPNELKPFLPYAAAALPFMLGPAAGMGGGSGLGALFRRGLLTGALPNIGAQLAQEGNEGELNPLSVLMATGSGIFSGQGAGDMFRGGMDKGKITGYDKIAGGNMPGQGGVNGVGGFTTNYDTKGISGLGKAKNFLLKGGAKLADTAAGAGEILRDPFAEGTSLLDVAKAGAFPVSQATGDVAYAQANKAMKDFNAQEAAQIVIDAATKAGMDQEYIDAITSSMGDYGYDQTDIDEILRVRGLFASGGRVGFRMGGGDFSAPDFISMDEVTENVDGDVIEDSFEGATAEGYKLNDFEINDMVMQMTGKKIYNLIDDPEAGNFDEFEVREMLYGDQYASGGIINAYNMGGSVLPQGMEMDYRQGGFIPMGSKERADDVPARVSKNEFVMTADAVRAAGGGSVNEGAKRMYGLMNNLEAKA
jgi:hypothetical protein